MLCTCQSLWLSFPICLSSVGFYILIVSPYKLNDKVLRIGDILFCKYNPNAVFVFGDLLQKNKRLSSQVKCFLTNAGNRMVRVTSDVWQEDSCCCGRFRILIHCLYLSMGDFLLCASLSTGSSYSLNKCCCILHHTVSIDQLSCSLWKPDSPCSLRSCTVIVRQYAILYL